MLQYAIKVGVSIINVRLSGTGTGCQDNLLFVGLQTQQQIQTMVPSGKYTALLHP